MIELEQKKYGILPWESRILIGTSLLNIFPVYYAFNRQFLFHAFTSIGTGVISILYWQNPIHGWRRNLDLFYAKYTFILYMGSGLLYSPTPFPKAMGVLGAVVIANTYFLSLAFPNIWIRFHILFHILSISMKMYILSQLCDNYLCL